MVQRGPFPRNTQDPVSGLLHERRDLRGDGIGRIFEAVVANTGQPVYPGLGKQLTKKREEMLRMQCAIGHPPDQLWERSGRASLGA